MQQRSSPVTSPPSPSPYPGPIEQPEQQAMVLRKLWGLLCELGRVEGAPALDALHRLHDQQTKGPLLKRADPPRVPPSGGKDPGGCSICVFDFKAGTVHMVLDEREDRTISQLALLVRDAKEAEFAYTAPEETVDELNQRREMTWRLPASASEMRAPLKAWARFSFTKGAELTELVDVQ
jgi:hypothetical protein